MTVTTFLKVLSYFCLVKYEKHYKTTSDTTSHVVHKAPILWYINIVLLYNEHTNKHSIVVYYSGSEKKLLMS